jgi:tRNA 5-methylaminomethyl-2-thiouridine biosynthesis bifunctional protein
MNTNCTTDVAIIGGGLAGASVSYALGARGIRSIIVERKHALAQGASGNRYALLMPYISASASPAESLYKAGFTHTKSLLTEALCDAGLFAQSGGLQLPSSARLRRLIQGSEELRSSDLIERVTALEASEIANSHLTEGAFYVSQGGYVSPPALVSSLVARHAPLASAICNAGVVSICKEENTWSLNLTDGTSLSAGKVVICSAFEASSLELCSWLPLEPIRGQTVILKSSQASEKLRTLLCFDGYITPAQGGEHLIGAIYRHGDFSHEVSQEDSITIIKRLHRALPQLALGALEEGSLISARACFRTSTFDRLPYIGALPDFHTMSESARRYQSGSDLTQRVPLTFHPGVFVSLGHGSRGLLSCPLAGEIIARSINGEEQPSLHEAARVTAAERYVYRALLDSSSSPHLD